MFKIFFNIFPKRNYIISNFNPKSNKGWCVKSHCGQVAIYIKKGILRQKKKNYGNSNISP
jgi:hypothetical protein